jgi:hypothetical protein
MSLRTLPLFLAIAALALFVALPVMADEQKGNTHTGTVVSITGQKLVMKGQGANAEEHTNTIADNAQVTCDGKRAELSDLKPGMKIRVTTKPGDKTMVTKVEALDKNQDFERGTNQGTDRDK